MKTSLSPQRASASFAVLQGTGLVHKRDARTACLGDVLALPEGNLAFSTARIQP